MRRGAVVMLLLGALACAGHEEQPPAEAQVASAGAAALPDESDSVRLRPRHLARAEERAPSRFPHAPHLRFDCTRCHTQVAGHERHANVPCRQCHEAPAPATAGASATDCRSCHHAANQSFGCSHCHTGQTAPPALRAVSTTLHIAGNEAARTLSFPHARHTALECTRCHARDHDAATRVACATCHTQHHRADANCASCHTPPRSGVHTGAVHQGCGGGGCHRDAEVLALPLSRSVCLSCHRAQTDHEPGGDCASCHNVRRRAAATGEAVRS